MYPQPLQAARSSQSGRTPEDRQFEFKILEEDVAAEAALDGIYVLRTNVPKKQMSAADTVRSYKGLCEVERAFRSLKTVDLKIRPIHHRLEDRVRAHIFLCMLAYYLEWHMRETWRELLFAHEDLEAKVDRDPVAPAWLERETQTRCNSAYYRGTSGFGILQYPSSAFLCKSQLGWGLA